MATNHRFLQSSILLDDSYKFSLNRSQNSPVSNQKLKSSIQIHYCKTLWSESRLGSTSGYTNHCLDFAFNDEVLPYTVGFLFEMFYVRFFIAFYEVFGD